MSRTSLIELFLALAGLGLCVAIAALLSMMRGFRRALRTQMDATTYKTLTAPIEAGGWPAIRWWCANCKRHTVGAYYCGECGAMRP